MITAIGRSLLELAFDKAHQVVLRGRIHQQYIDRITSENGSLTYLDPGDWIENHSAKENADGAWKLYQHPTAGVASATNEAPTHRLAPA